MDLLSRPIGERKRDLRRPPRSGMLRVVAAVARGWRSHLMGEEAVEVGRILEAEDECQLLDGDGRTLQP